MSFDKKVCKRKTKKSTYVNDRRQVEGLSNADTDITWTGLVVINEGGRSQNDMPSNRHIVSIFKMQYRSSQL